MKIFRIKHHGLDVVQVFRGGVMVWGRGFSMLSALESLSISGQGDLRTGAAAPLEATVETTTVDMQGTLAAPESAAVAAEALAEIETYADLYVYQAAHCAADTALTLAAQAQANAPESAACAAAENLDMLAEADAHAPISAPGSAETMMEVLAEAEANAPAAAPLSACLDWDFDIQVEATLTVASAAALAAETTVCVEHEAQADREITRYYTVRFFDGDTVLSEQQVAHGETAVPPDTTKEGYSFFGWEPSSLVITEDTDFYGIWDIGTTIVPRQTFTFANNNMFGGPYGAVYPDKTEWDLGKLGGICVEWDGVQYGPLQAQPISFKEGAMNTDCAGNRSIVTKLFGNTVTVTYPDTGEPFAVAWFFSYWRIATNNTDETHTVRIYTK